MTCKILRMKKTENFVLGILTFNRYDYLDILIDQIISQTIRPKEIIISDNGEGYSLKKEIDIPVTIIKNSYNTGFPKGINQMFRLASGNTILVMNDDNYLVDENSLEGLWEKFLKEKWDLMNCNNWASFIVSDAWVKATGFLDENIWPCYFEDSDYTQRIRKYYQNGISYNGTGCPTVLNKDGFEESKFVGNKRGTGAVVIQPLFEDLCIRNYHYYFFKWKCVKFSEYYSGGSLHDQISNLQDFDENKDTDVEVFETDYLKNQVLGNKINNPYNKISSFVDEVLKLKKFNFKKIIEIGTGRAYCSRLLLFLKPLFFASYDKEFNLTHDIIKHLNYLLEHKTSIDLKNISDIKKDDCDLLVVNDGYFDESHIEKINFNYMLFFGKESFLNLPIETFIEGEDFNMYLFKN